MIPLIDIHSHREKRLDLGLRIHQLNNSKPNLNLPFSISIHPWDIEKEIEFSSIIEFSKHENCLAIGETGLDKLRPSYLAQISEFRRHIQLAKRLQKPLIIHCVRAYEDCLRILKEEDFQGGVLFHGFNKNPQLAQQLIKKGYFLSLGSHFLKENPNFDRFFIETRFNHIIFETDNVENISIESLYEKAQKLCPNLDIKTIIYKNYKHWKTR